MGPTPQNPTQGKDDEEQDSSWRFLMMNERAKALGPDDIFEVLLDKLSRRGVLLAQIPRFVKDVLNIIMENQSFSEGAVNQKLGRLGWGDQILDGYILELIRFLSENQVTTEKMEFPIGSSTAVRRTDRLTGIMP